MITKISKINIEKAKVLLKKNKTLLGQLNVAKKLQEKEYKKKILTRKEYEKMSNYRGNIQKFLIKNKFRSDFAITISFLLTSAKF